MWVLHWTYTTFGSVLIWRVMCKVGIWKNMSATLIINISDWLQADLLFLYRSIPTFRLLHTTTKSHPHYVTYGFHITSHQIIAITRNISSYITIILYKHHVHITDVTPISKHITPMSSHITFIAHHLYITPYDVHIMHITPLWHLDHVTWIWYPVTFISPPITSISEHHIHITLYNTNITSDFHITSQTFIWHNIQITPYHYIIPISQSYNVTWLLWYHVTLLSHRVTCQPHNSMSMSHIIDITPILIGSRHHVTAHTTSYHTTQITPISRPITPTSSTVSFTIHHFQITPYHVYIMSWNIYITARFTYIIPTLSCNTLHHNTLQQSSLLSARGGGGGECFPFFWGGGYFAIFKKLF